MSDPLSRFQTLHINEMAETRAQRQRQQEQASLAAGRRGRGRARAIISPQPQTYVPPILGHSGMRYNTRRLSPDSAMRANEGLALSLFVDRLRSHKTREDEIYYAFQLKKPISVRIHDPARGANRVECTCGDQTPCIHVYWLFDGLKAVFNDHSTSNSRDISNKNMIAEEISDLYPLIGENIATLKRRLNTTPGSEQDSDTEDEAPDKSIVMDMLSVFDEEKLPDEYGSKFSVFDEVKLPDEDASESSEVSTDTALEDAAMTGNLPATIYGLAIRDVSFYMQLRRVVTRDVCAHRYLTKQQQRAKKSISMLDLPSSDPSIDPSLKVGECGKTLRRIVRQVCLYREARNSKRPLHSRVLTKATELLVDILGDVVCKHNKNIDQNASSGVDANLYTYLVGDPPPSEEGDFVIDQLRNFPQSEWRHLLEYLTTIADHVRDKAPQGQLRSIRYASKIEAMVNDYTSTAFEPSSSSHQRPASSGDRESLRRRYH